MSQICIWYLTAEGGVLDPETRAMIEGNGFQIKEPNNRDQFLFELDEIGSLDENEIQIHIHAHGSPTAIAPYNQTDIDRMRADDEEPNINADIVNYTDICPRIEKMIASGKNVTLNMMAVCNSYNTCINATLFLAFDGYNNDFLESWEIYPFNIPDYLTTIGELNARRNDNEGRYRFRTIA